MLDIGIVVGVIRPFPIHPQTQTLRLFGDDCGVFIDARAAFAGKIFHTKRQNIGFAPEAQRFLDFDFDPQTLAIEAVLPAQLATVHRVETLKNVFVSAAPGVMNAHRIVGGNWAVLEKPRLAIGGLRAQLVECALLFPQFENRTFEFGIVWCAFKRLKHNNCGVLITYRVLDSRRHVADADISFYNFCEHAAKPEAQRTRSVSDG